LSSSGAGSCLSSSSGSVTLVQLPLLSKTTQLREWRSVQHNRGSRRPWRSWSGHGSAP
jgi:hypothetical protein